MNDTQVMDRYQRSRDISDQIQGLLFVKSSSIFQLMRSICTVNVFNDKERDVIVFADIQQIRAPRIIDFC